MDNKGNSVIVFVIAIIFILAGIFVAVLTVSGTIEKAIDAQILTSFNVYIFGIIIAIVLVVIGFLLLYFGMQGN
ncbi:hypothetical protein MUO79_02005 [Candidatus Bathyarchaeota archaeon]|nr:hypothetical protein [Candidatus Bathyarchaeota archaeon]